MIGNIDTDYKIGDVFTFGYQPREIIDIRKDKNGYNEYLLSNGEWYNGWQMTTWSD